MTRTSRAQKNRYKRYKEMKYELNETQVKNLSAFLARVQLSGQEVGAFNDILKALGNPLPEEVGEDGKDN